MTKRRSKGKRKSTHKYPTIKVQGASSWIEFNIPTWAESRDAINEVRTNTKSLITREIDIERGTVIRPSADIDIGDAETALVDMIWTLAVNKFNTWNWVDNDGNFLPPMNEMDPGDLLQPELGAILEITQDLYGLRDLEEEGKARR